VGLQALASPVCAFSGLHDAAASPGAAPSGFSSSRIIRWADATEVTARLMAQERLTQQHTRAKHGAGGLPRAERGFPAGPEQSAGSQQQSCKWCSEAALEARQTWHNALAATVRHASKVKNCPCLLKKSGLGRQIDIPPPPPRY